MANFENFKVFKSETIGRIFMPDGFSCLEKNALHISPFHGRAIAIKKSDYHWVSIKGGGWNYGGPQIYLSKKDEELVFGLYGLSSAQRELQVNMKLQEISKEFPKVLYFKKFSDYILPKEFDCLKTITYKNGELVEPCLLYTQVKCPYRVADLMYLKENETKAVIESCCNFWGIKLKDYIQTYTKNLARYVAIMHKHGFINDTLDYGNVTMLAEIIDYEWVTAPGIKLLDGSYGLEITDARREKELLYGAEICLQLRALLKQDYNLFDIYEEFVSAYSEINPKFIKENDGVKKMLSREMVII